MIPLPPMSAVWVEQVIGCGEQLSMRARQMPAQRCKSTYWPRRKWCVANRGQCPVEGTKTGKEPTDADQGDVATAMSLLPSHPGLTGLSCEPHLTFFNGHKPILHTSLFRISGLTKLSACSFGTTTTTAYYYYYSCYYYYYSCYYYYYYYYQDYWTRTRTRTRTTTTTTTTTTATTAAATTTTTTTTTIATTDVIVAFFLFEVTVGIRWNRHDIWKVAKP